MNARFPRPAGEQSPVSLRLRLEREIERLIALLDAVDGDCDLEPAVDDEPSIGGNAMTYEMLDCEADDADREPSLGWVTLDSGRIVTGSDSDCEATP